MEAGALISELKRRRVIRALVGYGIAAFAVLQIIEPVMHGLHWPDEVLSYVVVALAVGFPVVVSVAWVFDVNQGRIERAATATGGPKGTRLGLLLVGVGVLAATPGTLWYLVLRRHAPAPASTSPLQPAVPSIAVLPFADMSPTHDQDYFSDGIAEEILNALAHVENLRVIGRTSSFSFKGKSEDLRGIGEKLGVAHVLEGSVRKAGDQIRITAQLINAVDGSRVWSETYDRRLADVFAVQAEIASAVVGALKVKLLTGQHPSVARTASTEAYQQYLLGSQITATYNPDDVRRAISAFEKAVALDPGMAAAWARLSIALSWMDDSPESRRRSIEAAERAVALDPRLAEGYAARSAVRNGLQWDFAGAAADDARALALAPNAEYVLILHCVTTRSRGLLAESRAACEKAIELDPLVVGARNNLTITYLASGNVARARSVNKRVLELSPGSITGQRMRCELDFQEGNRLAAREHCASFGDDGVHLFWNAVIAQEWGTRPDADQALESFLARSENDPYGAALVYAWRGDADHAFAMLDRAHGLHVGDLSTIKWNWWFRKVRSDPRYAALLTKMKLPLD